MKNVILVFFLWRVFITVAMIFGLVFPVQLGFLGGGVKNYYTSPLTWSWANFDGAHYLSLASFGYRQYEQAFFPLYPMLIHYLETISKGEYVLIGLLISNLSILLGIVVFYKLVQIDLKEKALWPVLFLLFFPTSFYFGSVYTEGLFFLLIVTSFFSARKKIWWLAGICGALASATRIVGVFILPALLVEYYLTCRSDKRSFFWLLLIPLGLFLYMFWLNQNYGDPWYFFHAQSFFSAGRSGTSFILLPQVIFRYLKILLTAAFNYQYLISLFEFILSMGIIGLLIYGYNKIRPSYWVFSFLCFIVPTLTGTFLSMPRFALTIFPLFIFLAAILNTYQKRVFLLSLFLLLLFTATMLYTRGYWIS